MDAYEKEDKEFELLIKSVKGIIGFVRFLKGFYMIVITKKKRVAWLEEHKIYKVK